MHVLGTAGHVDHGKSAFLRALTGMEPDRLPAEKKTGMTIDLNFVWLDPEAGARIGIVDVPGHKRFVKNMISGVMNVDAFLFIVAADDGWMPQSEEHLEVLSAMGINHGLAIVTKTDLVEPARVAEVSADVQRRFREGLGVEVETLAFSALQPETVPPIRTAIENLVARLPDPGEAEEVGRLWVDRVFKPKGIGVVVTGTLREGRFKVGDEVELLPQRNVATIKGLQSYKQNVDVAIPVSRVAVQLGRVEAEAIGRGSLLQKAKHVPLSKEFDARIKMFTKMKMKNLELPVHLGTSRTPALIIPLGEATGGGTFVRIKPRTPLPARAGDRFLLRTPGEEKNCGGGTIVDPVVRARLHADALSGVAEWEDSPKGYVMYRAKHHSVLSLKSLWDDSVYSRSQLEKTLADGGFVEVETGVFARERSWAALLERTKNCLSALHGSGKDTVGVHELEKSVESDLSDAEMDLLIEALVRTGEVQRVAQGVRLKSHKRELDPWEQKIWNLLLELFSKEGRPVRAEDFGDDAPKMRVLLQRLVKEGRLVSLAEEYYFGSEAFEALKAKVTAHLAVKEKATTSELRTLLNTSRKYAVLFLERMDQARVTFLKDGVRKLLK